MKSGRFATGTHAIPLSWLASPQCESTANAIVFALVEGTPRPRTTLPPLALAILTALSTLSCDRATKRLAVTYLEGLPPRSFFGDTIRLHYVENVGGFLGVGSGLPEAMRFTIFTLGSLAVLAAVVALFLRTARQDPAGVLAFGLVVGGGLSNLADRVFRDGRVVDFLNVGLGSLRTGIFNVADMCLLAGAVLILVRRARDTPAPPPS